MIINKTEFSNRRRFGTSSKRRGMYNPNALVIDTYSGPAAMLDRYAQSLANALQFTDTQKRILAVEMSVLNNKAQVLEKYFGKFIIVLI